MPTPPLVLALALALSLAFAQDAPDEAFFMDRRLKVEFVENTERQTYLSQISWDDRYVLDLYLLDQNLKNENFALQGQFARTCPRNVFRSLGLTGLNNPALRTAGIDVCPNMQANCCTANDLVGLDAIWRDYRAFLELNYDYFAYYAKTSLQALPQVVAQADALRNSSALMLCRAAADAFAKFNADDLSPDKFLAQLAALKRFDLRLKKGFQCLLCDYDNNQFIDLQNRVVLYSRHLCTELVRQALPFYTNLKDFFLRYFNSAVLVARCSRAHGSALETVLPFDEESFDFLDVPASYYDSECLKAYLSKDDDLIAQNCRNFCHKFDLWSFRGVLPDIPKMARMFKVLEDNLLAPLDVGVVRPKDQATTYAFPFASPLDDIFAEFDQMFGASGVHPTHLVQDDP